MTALVEYLSENPEVYAVFWVVWISFCGVLLWKAMSPKRGARRG